MSTDECTGHGSPRPQGGTERHRRGYRWWRSVGDGSGGAPDRSPSLHLDRDPVNLRVCPPDGLLEQRSDAEVDHDPQRMMARLRGVAIPVIRLESCWNNELVDVASLAAECLAIYLYPGNAGFSSDWQHSVVADVALHRIFHDRKEDLAAYRCGVVGVSTQPAWMQFHSAAHGRIDHHLLSDPTLQLAGKLALPTVGTPGQQFYEQQVLIVRGGRIRHIFYPANTDRCATQVAAWLKLN